MDAAKDLPVTFSTVRTETVSGSHVLKITGYSLNKGLGNGKYIKSKTFAVGGCEWRIKFYPEFHIAEDNASYIRIDICLAGNKKDVRANFELTLLDQSGRNQHKVRQSAQLCLFRLPQEYEWGWKRFLETTLLDASDYLKNDSLLIGARVDVVRSVTVTESPEMYGFTLSSSNTKQNDSSSSSHECDAKEKRVKKPNMFWGWLMRLNKVHED